MIETAEKTTIEQIQEQYALVKSKSKFILKLAKVVKRTPLTVRHHWIGQLWSIPEEFQQTVLDEINKELKIQSNEKS